MVNIIEAVRDFLDADDWHYDYNAEKQIIECGAKVKCKLKNIRLLISFNDKGYTVFARIPISAEEDTMNDVMRYITMANYGLRNGNFELDVRDGELRYKVYTNCADLEELPKRMIQDSIYIPWIMVERYGNGLAALCMGFSTPDEEIKKAEGNGED
ncbi:MAG: YbjN domain-containing protein [Eubacteriales bacterium]|nr:YbjN domain-containing protein [Eubacteriales bacterium]